MELAHFLLPADWVWAAIALTMAVMGLFRGFSGALAFLVGMAAAAAAAFAGWEQSARFLSVEWQRGGATLAAALLAFGLARIIVKKIVNCLLAQPTDAILGLLACAASGVVLLLAWAKSGLYIEYSFLATEVARHVW